MMTKRMRLKQGDRVDQHQYEEILLRLVTISLDITTFIEKQTQINDRLTTLLESLGHPPADGQEGDADACRCP